MTLTIALTIVIFGGAIIVRKINSELKLPAVFKEVGIGIGLAIWLMLIGAVIFELATIWH